MRFAAFVLAALCALAALNVLSVQAAVAGDLVKNLPGFGAPPTTQYSGFIAADSAQTVFLHYWYVEAAQNPSTAPLVLWMNGGPGCSSLDGYLYEQGPLHFSGKYDSTGLPLLVENPNAWTNIANMIFLEAPAGVGFSFAVNGSTSTNDEITSQNNYGFLLNFFQAYPELAGLDFYITGESYAGIYVPTLVDRIRVGALAGENKINLKGFAVGNGCWGNAVGTCAQYGPFDNPNTGLEIQLDFLLGHAFYSPATQAIIASSCGNLTNPNPSAQCQNALNTASNAGGDYNIYNIYDWCPSPVTTQLRAPNAFLASRAQTQQMLSKATIEQKLKKKLGADPAGCIGTDYAVTWLSNQAVREALNLLKSPTTEWSICASIDYEKTVQSLLPLYPTLIKQYRTLIYSGDVDACVPYVGTEEWTRGLGFSVADAWRPWNINDQVAGYVVTYATNGFTFLTVKGAGHMVPQYQPIAAFQMFQRWITNSPF